MKLCPRSTLIAFVLSAALAACGGGGDNAPSEVIANPDGGGADADPVTQSAAGVWRGTSDTGRSVAGVVFDDGVFWFTYTAEQSSLAAGVVTGQASVNDDGQLTGVGTDLNFNGAGSRAAELSGDVLTRQSLFANVMVDGESVLQFSSEFSLQDEQPADLSTVLGTFDGTASTVAGAGASQVIVGDAGMLAGVSAQGCNYAGSVSPRSDINVFDVSLSFGGDMCLFADVQGTGVAWLTDQQTFMATVLIEGDVSSALVFNGVLEGATAQ